MIKVLLVGDGKHEGSGALAALVQQVLAPEITFDCEKMSRNQIHAHHGKGQGFFKRAVRWMIEARRRGCYDALILLVDEDHQRERVREIADAQESKLGIKRRALGVAIHTFDAWMLADEQCLTQILERPIQRQPDPETIPDPKAVCSSLRDASPSRAPAAALYADLASRLNIETLKKRCPKGFAPFAQRVRELQPSKRE